MTFNEINEGIWNIFGEHGAGGERNSVYVIIDENIAIIDAGIRNTIQNEIAECIEHA